MAGLIKIRDRQTLFDVAIQEYGNVEAAIDVAWMNNLSLTDDVEAGIELKLPLTERIDREVQNYYKRRDLRPTTGFIPENLLEIIEDECGICGEFTNEFDEEFTNCPCDPMDSVFAPEFDEDFVN